MEGNITVIESKRNYKMVSKDIIFDGNVDALSVGVFFKLISLSNGWNLKKHGLCSLLSLSEKKVRHCLMTLEKNGYLKRVAHKCNNGLYSGWDYIISSERIFAAGQENESADCVSASSKESDIAENGRVRKRTCPKTDVTENGRDRKVLRLYTKTDSYTKTNNHTKTESNPAPSAFDFKKALIENGCSESLADDFMTVRRRKRAVNTERALNAISAEASKAGITFERAVTLCVEQSWQSFRASWYSSEKKINSYDRQHSIPTSYSTEW